MRFPMPCVARSAFEMAIRENAYLREQVAEARSDLRELLSLLTGPSEATGLPPTRPARPPKMMRVSADQIAAWQAAKSEKLAEGAAIMEEAFDVR